MKLNPTLDYQFPAMNSFRINRTDHMKLKIDVKVCNPSYWALTKVKKKHFRHCLRLFCWTKYSTLFFFADSINHKNILQRIFAAWILLKQPAGWDGSYIKFTWVLPRTLIVGWALNQIATSYAVWHSLHYKKGDKMQWRIIHGYTSATVVTQVTTAQLSKVENICDQ